MLALFLDVADEDLHLFQGVADDVLLDILPVVAPSYFFFNVLHDPDGSSAKALKTFAFARRGALPVSPPTPLCTSSLIKPADPPPPPALPLSEPVAYCPRISVGRVSVRTRVDSAMPL